MLNKMKKADVLLIYPQNEFVNQLTAGDKLHHYRVGNKKFGTWPPLGLLYLASSLEKKGISCGVLDAFVKELTIEEVLRTVKAVSPKVIGISITTLQIRGAVQLAHAIKKRYKKIKIGIGGPHASVDPGFVKKFKCFDFCITGEAEITFPKIVQNILKNKKVSRVIKGELPIHLDQLPFPARDKIKIKDYFELERPTATILTSRGCPFKCLFCSRVAISDRVRFREPKLVADEIESLKADYQHITFLDDTFTLSKTHTLALCEEMIKRNLRMKWTCNTRANLLDRELVEKMKAAGCDLILIGVESGDEGLRNGVVRKKITDREIESAIKICKKAKITVGGYFMLGFPGETSEKMSKTVNYPVKYKFDIMSIHATTIYPGSDLFELSQKENKQNYLDLWYRYARGESKLDDLPLVYVPAGMEFSEIEKARKRAYRKFYTQPSAIFKQALKDISSFKDLKRDFFQALMLFRFGKTSKDLK